MADAKLEKFRRAVDHTQRLLEIVDAALTKAEEQAKEAK